MGGANAADGGLVATLAGTGELVDDQGSDALFGEKGRGRHADAPGANDDNVEGLGADHRPPSWAAVGWRRGASSNEAPAGASPANAPSGTSMMSGRFVRSVIW